MTEDAPFNGYLSRDPKRWTGFVPAKLEDLSECYDFEEGEGRARRGVDQVEYRFRVLAVDDFDEPFFFHFDKSGLGFIETDYWSLETDICQRLLADLGSPPERLDAFFRQNRIADAEWIYPDRGLALCVVPETQLIARWTVFSPVSSREYERRIKCVSLAREFEPRAF